MLRVDPDRPGSVKLWVPWRTKGFKSCRCPSRPPYKYWIKGYRFLALASGVFSCWHCQGCWPFCCNNILLIHVHDLKAHLYIEKLKGCVCPSLIRISQNGSTSHTFFRNLGSGSPQTSLWVVTPIPPVRELCLLKWWSTGHVNTIYHSEKLGKLCNTRRSIVILLKPFHYEWYTWGLWAILWSWQ